jgi:hypothetical protein
MSTAENTIEATHKRVLNLIKETGGLIKLRDLGRKTSWLTKKQRESIIETLIDNAYIEIVQQRGANERGPKATFIKLID